MHRNFITVDITETVRQWLNNPGSNFGLVLRTEDARLYIQSKENVYAGHSMEVEINLANAGPQGPVGPQGPEGEQGPAGLQGVTGLPGPQGTRGENRAAGATREPQGEIGAVGEQGPEGQMGPPGPVGPQGPAAQVSETLPGVVFVESGSSVSSNTARQVSVKCPQGTIATGGGYRVSGAEKFVNVTASRPIFLSQSPPGSEPWPRVFFGGSMPSKSETHKRYLEHFPYGPFCMDPHTLTSKMFNECNYFPFKNIMLDKTSSPKIYWMFQLALFKKHISII